MDLKQKLAALEEIMDVEEGTINPEMELESISEWDSLSALSFVVFMGDEFGKKVSGAQVRAFKTVQDILDMMEE